MNAEDAQLQTLLRKDRTTPQLPPHFRQNVWRRIEDAGTSVKAATWLDTLATFILRPRFALAAGVALVLAGCFIGATEGVQTARHDAQMNYLSSVAPHSPH